MKESLPTLSDPDRELCKGAVLSAHKWAESTMIQFTGNSLTGTATNTALTGDGLNYQTCQAKKKTQEKKEAKRAASKKVTGTGTRNCNL